MGKKKPSKRRLQNLSDVRRFLADIVNQLNRDEIDGAKAGKIGDLSPNFSEDHRGWRFGKAGDCP